MESENVNVVKRLFKIQNLNASTIRTVMVADCSRFDSPDLLLDAGAAPGCVFDLGGDDEHDEAAGPAPVRAKEGLRRLLDGLLDGQTQPQLAECALETKVAELLAQGRTKPPECSAASALDKLLIFTTGCLTYSPHQIGNHRQGQSSVPKHWAQELHVHDGPSLVPLLESRDCGQGGAHGHWGVVGPSPGPSAGIKHILPHQMTTAGPVLGEGRGSDAFFDALDHVIDVRGHIIGMGLSPDNRCAQCWGGGI